MPVFAGVPDDLRYRKCRPSGKKDGSSCERSFRDGSSTVNCVAVPPVAGSFHKPPRLFPKMITPSRFQEPPIGGDGRSHKDSAAPLLMSAFLSFTPLPENTTERLSGDQKKGGARGPVSASGNRRVVADSRS